MCVIVSQYQRTTVAHWNTAQCCLLSTFTWTRLPKQFRSKFYFAYETMEVPIWHVHWSSHDCTMSVNTFPISLSQINAPKGGCGQLIFTHQTHKPDLQD